MKKISTSLSNSLASATKLFMRLREQLSHSENAKSTSESHARIESLEPRLLMSASDVVVTINEVMYNPAGADETLEFVELYNQYAVNVDVSGWELSDAIDFKIPENTVMPGGSYLVIAKDPAAL